MDLTSVAVTRLKGVGPKQAEKLKRLKIVSLQDVLFHLPLRYQDRTRVVAIEDLVPGVEVMTTGMVVSCEVLFRSRRSLLCVIADRAGNQLSLRFFHFNQQQQQRLKPGSQVRCFGEVRRGPNQLEMVHPEIQVVATNSSPSQIAENALTPVYPVTEGLHQLSMRKITDAALQNLKSSEVEELLPATVNSGVSLKQALLTVHRPGPEVDVDALLQGDHQAVQRLVLEELVAHRLSVQQIRNAIKKQNAPVINTDGDLCQRLISSLPFTLTAAQQRVIDELYDDLKTGVPMLRLVQGDVGSGKTLVAAAAAALVVDAGYQVAVMAPTEILAEQHLFSFTEWFEPLGLKIGWLKGKLGAKQKRATLESVAQGLSMIAVGTHALFQQDVVFKNLGLTIVDEQHRFGVHQRLSLREKGVDGDTVPHQLTMTATPIPRTLAMTAYADLDYSVIDELPPGRQAITTVAIPNARRTDVIERVAEAIKEGRQIYWVCTLIEESEALQANAAEDTLVELQEYLPDARVSLVHGRMHPTEKEHAMMQFKDHTTDLLVATTVIEVGVDVPNASLIIIENAERLGLSQLHQLRGRVGRGAKQSSCVLLYEQGLSQRARDRISTLRETNDGFLIAERDLELRGAGEVLGTRQTGAAQFRIADLIRDKKLLPEVKTICDEITAQQPEHVVPLILRWLGEESPEYGNV